MEVLMRLRSALLLLIFTLCCRLSRIVSQVFLHNMECLFSTILTDIAVDTRYQQAHFPFTSSAETANFLHSILFLPGKYFIDHTIFLRLFGRHPIVTVRVGIHFLVWRMRMIGDNSVQLFLKLEDLLGLDLDI